MAGSTSIQWTDASWNPVRGCSRVSEGCRNCYAERVAARFSGVEYQGGLEIGRPFHGFAEQTDAGPRWTGKVELVPSMLDLPLRRKKPRKIFVNSMSDLFHEKLRNEEIAAVFGVMAACPQHTFQVLTKRTKRMREWVGWVLRRDVGFPAQTCAVEGSKILHGRTYEALAAWPLPNVWLGTSVEDQSQHERVWDLLKTPAAIRFVSLEPLLGPVDLDAIEALCLTWRRGATIGTYLDWVIVGGESGPGARPFDIVWARSTIAQCKAAGVAVFCKQMGSNAVETFDCPGPTPLPPWPPPQPCPRCNGTEKVTERRYFRDRKGGDWSEWSEDLRVREFPGGASWRPPEQRAVEAGVAS